jgi:hypothetical protein
MNCCNSLNIKEDINMPIVASMQLIEYDMGNCQKITSVKAVSPVRLSLTLAN